MQQLLEVTTLRQEQQLAPHQEVQAHREPLQPLIRPRASDIWLDFYEEILSMDERQRTTQISKFCH